MSEVSRSGSRVTKGLILAVVVVFVSFLYILFKSIGLYPLVMSDEYNYSKYSRLLPFSQGFLPNYLYFLIYSATSYCGDGFLQCSRGFNVAFFVCSFPFIYLVSRLVVARTVSFFIALVCILGPLNSYTAYYMPDSLYFFSFWVFCWFTLRLDLRSGLASWSASGAILGVCSVIKPHAFFLVPVVVLYISYSGYKILGIYFRSVVARVLVFVLAVFLVRVLLGYLIAGQSGFSVFGDFYSSEASKASGGLQKYISLARLGVYSAIGHILSLSVLFGLPLAIALTTLGKSFFSKGELCPRQKISFFLIFSLLVLVAVVALFTASVAGGGGYETITRLHMRYYDFLFPMFLIVAAAQIKNVEVSERKWIDIVCGVIISASALYVVYNGLDGYTPGFVDSPILRGITSNVNVFFAFCLVSFGLITFWVMGSKKSIVVFLYCYVPLSMAFSSFYLNKEMYAAIKPTVFDTAGIFARQYLPSQELPHTLVVGKDVASLYRALFHIDSVGAKFEALPEGQLYNFSTTPEDTQWVLAIGDRLLPERKAGEFRVEMNGFQLVRVGRNMEVDFARDSWPGILESVGGLSWAEPWGRWSDTKTISLKFLEPLPEHLKVTIAGRAFGPNVGKVITLNLGAEKAEFSLGAAIEEKVIYLRNDGYSRSVFIDVPDPVSPMEMGASTDGRKLGIGLVKLRVEAD
ncbi:hypothetical protein QL104_10125 [Pseudomonas piscis]|uniref:DUF7024 domain-containing protein n=1 Tax=Pseudomonas piscis TaxID=2614538 RepID=A0ABY9NMF8_9PSED|nr:hypothetical protein [Pseudomonas piscis]WMN19744.1 hypothetical protein QL104_10125 [Pseudomonas piscis]